MAEAADLTAPLAGKSTLNRLELSAGTVGATTGTTATCRSTSSLASICSAPVCARPTSTRVRGAGDEFARIVAQVRAAWPEVAITVRADSGFCRDALLVWCEQHGVDYVIGLAKNTRLTALIAGDLAAVETESIAARTPVRRFADLTYETVDSWSRARRVVAKAEYLPTARGEGKANPRFVVTSLPLDALAAKAL